MSDDNDTTGRDTTGRDTTGRDTTGRDTDRADTTAPAGGEPFDQTNGVVDGLHGDDDGAVEPELEPGGIVGNAIRDVLGTGEDGATEADRDPAKTPYSEEGAR